jgi:hypothetical protein
VPIETSSILAKNINNGRMTQVKSSVLKKSACMMSYVLKRAAKLNVLISD